MLCITCFHRSPKIPRLDTTRCQLMENTPDLNLDIFDPDQVGGITTKGLGYGLASPCLLDFMVVRCFESMDDIGFLFVVTLFLHAVKLLSPKPKEIFFRGFLADFLRKLEEFDERVRVAKPLVFLS